MVERKNGGWGGGNVGISHTAIGWSSSQQDGLSSPSLGRCCWDLRPRPGLQQGTQWGLHLPILPVERAFHP